MPGIRLLYVARRRNPQQAHSAGSETKRPGDTLKAYAKAMDLIAKLKAGADFDSLAMAESEDPTVESNRGDLYFFTGGQMVMPFENGAWVMKVNETSSIPIHHLIRLSPENHAASAVRGSIKVRHIMALAKQAPTDTADTAAALGRLRAWQDSLAKGIDLESSPGRLRGPGQRLARRRSQLVRTEAVRAAVRRGRVPPETGRISRS